ncbi:hypothetical protein KP509_10G053200 [Ceratopteris richardii]|uniref:Uncharacterized protein n=1 Tax=Ceratopteris richardii TaxID=49495 RepID=A0A8T2U1G2_CERRI|nr:hypothetical protein KP509_1Z111500 [Ceratopteris richardii]KAH7427643.1 hypothetical protein KP509_10G053200 [Ceratopteris richardii]
MQSLNAPAPISSATAAAISTALASSLLAPAYATTSSQRPPTSIKTAT